MTSKGGWGPLPVGLQMEKPHLISSFVPITLLSLTSGVCILSCFSCVQLSVTPSTVAHQAPLSMGFSRQKYWSGLPFPTPEDLPDPGIEPMSPVFPAGGFFTH